MHHCSILELEEEKNLNLDCVPEKNRQKSDCLTAFQSSKGMQLEEDLSFFWTICSNLQIYLP